MFRCFLRLKKLHRNVNASLDRLEKFIFTEWAYSATRTSELHKWLKPSDQVDFNIEIKTLSWAEYFSDLTQGARRYLSKENPKNLPAAKGKDTMYVGIPLLMFADAVLCFLFQAYGYAFGSSRRLVGFDLVRHCLFFGDDDVENRDGGTRRVFPV